ncbi:ku70-like protein [Heliocybe sulcata]|uniref:ATP-dependent DNA helicase II subunit 1 n=1 Tax=Heliocybe sulcata TaxID=5364 RepID=A0A5C3MYQ8_9AGAM|nr:ku70-like protein [Heliocybe sulcata]
MAPYEEWNRIDEDEEEELQDTSWLEGKRDVILFCIDCSDSMLELYDDPTYEDLKTCHLYSALEAAMQIQKRKVLVGPNDAVGILLFNTTRKNESTSQGSEIKRNNFIYQSIAQISAPKVMELMQLLDAAREDPEYLRNEFPPVAGKRVPMGDVFTSCNWALRDGAPKTATKRVFLITDEDNPHHGVGGEKLITSSQTTLLDLTQAGVAVEPFFISTEEKPFDTSIFYSSVLLPTNLEDVDDDPDQPTSILPESISITRIEDLISQMRIYEVPKRSLFNVPFQLADGFVIGVKGYGLVTEQHKGSYKYFVDLGDKMEVANSKTIYADIDDDSTREVPKSEILYGMTLGGTPESNDTGGRIAPIGSRVFYTAEEVKSFRSMGLEPGIKLLGFKDRTELLFADNVKHSTFIYPDEMTYSGSKRTFSALLKSMIKKDKIGLALVLMRRNSSPVFCALLPQEEKPDETGWLEPSGFHLIPLPYADDIRSAPIDEAARASDELRNAARAWITKLTVGAYPPDSYPNPALAYHNAQLEASAFREEYDPESFEDLTIPKYDLIHKRAGPLMQEWKAKLLDDEASTIAVPTTGSKRKADISVSEAEIRQMYENGTLNKLRNDQLKEFLKSKGLASSGTKAVLIERVGEWLESHPS